MNAVCARVCVCVRGWGGGKGEENDSKEGLKIKCFHFQTTQQIADTGFKNFYNSFHCTSHQVKYFVTNFTLALK